MTARKRSGARHFFWRYFTIGGYRWAAVARWAAKQPRCAEVPGCMCISPHTHRMRAAKP